MNISKEYSLHYVYRHIRLDKNEPFYIGIGTGNLESKKETMFFRRAYERKKKSRNAIWRAIAAKTDFEVEIVFCSPDLFEVEKKEIELIAMYGRISEGTGTLANIHEGGKITKKERKQRRGKKDPKTRKKKVFVYNTDGSFLAEYESQADCSRILGMPRGKAVSLLKGYKEYKTWHGLKFFYEYQGDNIGWVSVGSENKRTPISIYDKDMNFVKRVESQKGTAVELNVTLKKVVYYSKTGRLMPEGYYLKYEN